MVLKERYIKIYYEHLGMNSVRLGQAPYCPTERKYYFFIFFVKIFILYGEDFSISGYLFLRKSITLAVQTSLYEYQIVSLLRILLKPNSQFTIKNNTPETIF